jgi:hypothetical protein
MLIEDIDAFIKPLRERRIELAKNTNDIYKSNQVKISFVDGSGDLEILPNGDLTNQSQFITFGQAVGQWLNFST